MKHLLLQLSKIVIIIVSILIVSSCGYKDIDKRAFVVTIGVDQAESDDKKYKVMLKVAIPAADIKEGKPEAVVSEHESNSITDAVRIIKSKVDKELDFSHAKVIIFGEKVLEEDINGVLDWFIRRRDIQKIAWVGIGKPSAEEILKLDRKVERLPANSLFLSFGGTGTESVYIVSEYLFDFRKRLTEKGLDPILPILEAKEQKYFEINKAALFDSEKIRLTLAEEETKILNILLNRTKKVDIGVKLNEEDKQDSFFISVDQSAVSYKIVQENNEAVIVANIKMEGIIEETLIDINAENLVEIKKIAEENVKNKVLKLLTRIQEENLDPLGFGLQYRANSFAIDDWEQWQSIYPGATFNVNVDITLQGTGLLK